MCDVLYQEGYARFFKGFHLAIWQNPNLIAAQNYQPFKEAFENRLEFLKSNKMLHASFMEVPALADFVMPASSCSSTSEATKNPDNQNNTPTEIVPSNQELPNLIKEVPTETLFSTLKNKDNQSIEPQTEEKEEEEEEEKEKSDVIVPISSHQSRFFSPETQPLLAPEQKEKECCSPCVIL